MTRSAPDLIDLAAIRTEYARAGLVETDLHPSPLRQLERWLRDALDAGHPEPTAMTLATASPDGEPSARVVLLKGIGEEGLVFYTSYEATRVVRSRTIPARAPSSIGFCSKGRFACRARRARCRARNRRRTSAHGRARVSSARGRRGRAPCSRAARSSRLGSRKHVQDSRTATCLVRRRGAVTGSRSTGSSSGKAGRAALHDRLRYTRTPSAPTGWRIERLSP